MKYRHINGTIFQAMIVSGYNNLCNHEKEINAMNVFPVSDGDTGTNMRTTLENGIQHAKPTEHLGAYLKELSTGMLWGARGNSGVILSQLFKGFADELTRCSIANVGETCDALVKAYRTAYRSVVHPVEGTILTAAREGIENIKSQLGRGNVVNDVFSLYLAEMRKSLEHLPDLLPVLKEAGVTDSGALGYITVIDGMVKAMYDEGVKISEGGSVSYEDKSAAVFNADSEFTLGYCTEFLLQTLKSKTARCPFRVKEFTNALSALGDSLIVIEQDGIVKVHVHTLTPAKVIEEAQRYGEFTAFKLENMQLQHSEFVKEKEEQMPHKNFAVIAVAEGDGITKMFRDCGADIVIDGGSTMGVSADEFAKAYRRANADRVVVLPNNGNNEQAAEQAKQLSGKENITVLPTKTMIEGYYALAFGTADIEDADERIAAMTDGMQSAITVSLARSVKDYTSEGVSCKAGDYIAFVGKKPAFAGASLKAALLGALLKVESMEEKSCMYLIKGKEFSEDMDELALEIEGAYSLTCEMVEGGQNIYELIVGVI
ncbi:MAG: DAK2 domain-containing protein [Clostridia bacterium]|nr:DAK2 domain-containing protein [Clostridia bacterium]